MKRTIKIKTVDLNANRIEVPIEIEMDETGTGPKFFTIRGDYDRKTAAKALYDAWVMEGRPAHDRAKFYIEGPKGVDVIEPKTAANNAFGRHFVEVPCSRMDRPFGGEFMLDHPSGREL